MICITIVRVDQSWCVFSHFFLLPFHLVLLQNIRSKDMKCADDMLKVRSNQHAYERNGNKTKLLLLARNRYRIKWNTLTRTQDENIFAVIDRTKDVDDIVRPHPLPHTGHTCVYSTDCKPQVTNEFAGAEQQKMSIEMKWNMCHKVPKGIMHTIAKIRSENVEAHSLHSLAWHDVPVQWMRTNKKRGETKRERSLFLCA